MRARHLVVGMAAGVLAALAMGAPTPGVAKLVGELEVYDVVPPDPVVRVRVGDRRQFAVWAAGEDLRYRWTLDDARVGERRSWTLEATLELAGSHRVAVDIEGDEGRVSRSWTVTVDYPPHLVTTTSTVVIVPPTTASSSSTSSSTTTTTTTTSSTTSSSTTATTTTSTTTTSSSTTTWTTSTTRATTTTSTTTTFAASTSSSTTRPGTTSTVVTTTVLATTTSSTTSSSTTSTTRSTTTSTSTTTAAPTSSSTSRPSTTSVTSSTVTRVTSTSSTRAPTTTRPSTTSTSRASTTIVKPTTSTTSSFATTSTVVRPTTSTTAAPTRAGSGVTPDDVRALLARYVGAWRAHDAEALLAIGQITTRAQVEALESYFRSVPDLDVEVTVLDIEPSGDGARVRFVRRDRFKDPAGNLVTKESPPIEKRVVRTAGGLRFAPAR